MVLRAIPHYYDTGPPVTIIQTFLGSCDSEVNHNYEGSYYHFLRKTHGTMGFFIVVREKDRHPLCPYTL
jgi:hypothetical protein